MSDKILNILKDKKVKITNERKEIIAVLESTNLPLSPADIFLRIIPKLPRANLTTVYRNLEMLEGFNLVKRLTFNKNSFSYELVGDRLHHHHVICGTCGKVEDLETQSESFIKEVQKLTKFRILDHNLEFFGLCLNCQN